MDGPNQKNRKMIRPLLVVSLLVLVAVVVLNACVVPTVMPPEEATAAAQVNGDVKATVDAAIALAVKATLTAVSPSEEGNDTSGEGDAIATVVTTTTTVEPEDSVAAPLLITPTPDRSAEIMDVILQNTRHFRGDPDASVVIVEFSDFL